jgi:pimeloyl-ACP methyl ester carboxylesterase
MRRFGLLLSLVLTFLLAKPLGAMTADERQKYWDEFSQIIPPVPSFTAWMQANNALPPDFDALPRISGLPDPLTFADGKRKVLTADDWKDRRAEILKLYEMYDIGTIPPKATLDQIITIDPAVAATDAARGGRFGRGPTTGPAGFGNGPTTGPAAGFARGGPTTGPFARGGRFGRGGTPPAPGSVTRVVDLKYGPGDQITTRVTLTIPPGTGPFPVLMCGTPSITNQGYISCAYNNSVDPPPGNPDGPLNLRKYYPDYTFGSMGQQAFQAQMIVDYLYTLPEVDKPHIAITGYSRLGKEAAIAAMFDERITACVAGSTGVGGILSWRSAGEYGAVEGIESTTRSFPTWFAPQLRFFTGREDRLPIDGNLIQAAIAPRSIISLYGLSDEVGNTYGNEQSYYSSEKVFNLLGVPDHNSIIHPPGHHGANDVAATTHWLDIQFGKSTDKWENKFLYPWDFDKWRTDNNETVDLSKFAAHNDNGLGAYSSTADWETKAADIRKSVQWMLGTRDGGKGGPDPAQRGRDDVVDWAIQRGGAFGWLEPQKDKTEYRSITFGDGTRGELYYPKGTKPDAKLPTVIWLHGFSYPMGYMWVYRSKPDLHPILALVEAGYAVFAFDQTGHGSRTDEFATFFDRFPHWSRMGRMVSDTSAAIDTLQKDGMVDPNRIYLYGYSMGGMIAMYTAALDQRVKGAVSICGFTPMRTDTADRGTGGLARFSVVLPLVPRLGFFIGNESKLPYDYNELMATIAPRPVYVLEPQLDRDATPSDVHGAVDQAKKVFGLYNATDKLVLDEPFDYNRLPEVSQDRIVKWMTDNMR